MLCRRSVIAGCCLIGVVCFGMRETADAVFLDKDNTLQFTARLQTKQSIRMNDSEGFTFPHEIGVGDLVQWRNLALIEIQHDLVNLTEDLGLLYPLKALRIDSKYRFVGRFIYDAVYDVGPEVLQDVKERDKENFDELSHQYELYEFYVDLSRGPWFLRTGRQILAWGETDMFRLLDSINPLDNTWGGLFEDLDDRRIPLWMLRGSYKLGDRGSLSDLSLEGFWVPGFWDASVSPMTPTGSPYAAPAEVSEPEPGEIVVGSRTIHPSKEMSSSRWGFRLMGIVGSNLNFSLAHYRTYLDNPMGRLVVDDPNILSLSLANEISWEPVEITGGTISFWEPHTDLIVRSEVACFWDEPVFIMDINAPVHLTQVIPFLPAIPIPETGSIPKKNVLKYMIGLDRNFWIRPLNPYSTFMVTTQYFGQCILDYDDRIKLPISIYPDASDFIGVRQFESTLTAMITTNYWNGRLTPAVATGYNVRGAWLLSPSLSFLFEPFRFMVKYDAIYGNFVDFGIFRDRDQLCFTFTYLLN